MPNTIIENGLTVNGSINISGTGGGIIPPTLTTTERNALTPQEGMFINNSTTGDFERYHSAAWETLAGGGLPAYNHIVTVDIGGEGDVTTIASGIIAIQTAADAAENNRYGLILKPGMHTIDNDHFTGAPVTCPSWVYIISEQPLAATINYTSTSNPVILPKTNSGFYGIEFKTLNNTVLTYGGAITIATADNINFTNCSFRSLSGTTGNVAIGADYCGITAPIWFINCQFAKAYNSTDATGVVCNLNRTTAVFNNCSFTHYNGAGILTGDDCNITVNNTIFKNNDESHLDSSFFGIVLVPITGSSTFIINGCIFDHLESGVYLKDNTLTATSPGSFAHINNSTFLNFDVITSGTSAVTISGTNNIAYLKYSAYDPKSLDFGDLNSGTIIDDSLSPYAPVVTTTGTTTLTLTPLDPTTIVVTATGLSSRSVVLPATGDSFEGKIITIINGTTTSGNIGALRIFTSPNEYIEPLMYIQVIRLNNTWQVFNKGTMGHNFSPMIESYAYSQAIAIGHSTRATAAYSIAIGENSWTSEYGSIALGKSTRPRNPGEVKQSAINTVAYTAHQSTILATAVIPGGDTTAIDLTLMDGSSTNFYFGKTGTGHLDIKASTYLQTVSGSVITCKAMIIDNGTVLSVPYCNSVENYTGLGAAVITLDVVAAGGHEYNVTVTSSIGLGTDLNVSALISIVTVGA